MPRRDLLLLVPIGPVPSDVLPELGEMLCAIFGHPWIVAQRISLPEETYSPQRGQYLSDALLAWLPSLPAPKAWCMLGVVEADLYTPGLNFVFGQAAMSGHEALVALARLRPSFYGLPEDEEIFRERLLKEAVHELGHSQGLAHCPDPLCVMRFSNSLADTDRKSSRFCLNCARQAAVAVR